VVGSQVGRSTCSTGTRPRCPDQEPRSGRDGGRRAVPPPPLTAADSLYPSTGSYASLSSQDGAPYRWGGATNCDVIYGNCVSAAQSTHNFGTSVCSRLGGPSAAAQRCIQIADADFQSALASCRQQFLCASAADCKQSPVAPHGFRCCPPGTQACGTGSVPDCVPECPPRKLIPINASSCTCVCDPLLQECELTWEGFQKIRDPTTCLCVCPPATCTGGKIQNPNTCLCECPSGWTDCKNVGCRNLSGDRFNCGKCGNACAPDEDCCNGNCEKLNADPHCGSCGANCGASGQTCCVTPPGAARGHCSTLVTRQDCGQCGKTCADDELCCPPDKTRPARCSNLLSTSDCGQCGIQCAPGQGCCHQSGLGPAQCVSLNTTLNCGQCNKTCTGGTCVNGTCVCPTGQVDCGGKCCAKTCCPPKGGQPAYCADLTHDAKNCGGCGTQCPTGQTCCPPGKCVDLKTDLQNCGSCGKTCIPEADETCLNGQCQCLPGQAYVTCPAGGRTCCPSGEFCSTECPGTGGRVKCCPYQGGVCSPAPWIGAGTYGCCPANTPKMCPGVPSWPVGWCCAASDTCSPTRVHCCPPTESPCS
jgi:hypothetical protein